MPVLLAILVTLAPAAIAGVPERAVRILKDHCVACHGESGMSDLDLRTRGGLLQGGKRGPAVVPGDAEASVLARAVRHEGDLAMPLQSPPLSATESGVLEEWINAGARWPAEQLLTSGETWWSFIPVARPEVPPHGSGWARTAIDRFLARALAREGLEPAVEADRRTWIRRATYDLHGLPPTPAEVAAFLRDDSPDAFGNVIDRLLESERYGERWGRYWLDVVRYADSGGFETDIYYPNAWRFRDYVIKSFNDDKPFDRFVREQVAADEIWPDDIELRGSYEIPEEKQRNLEARIGTGLYAVGTVYHEAALNGHQLRYEWMVDSVDVTGEAFLGLTIGCARCHDHMFDPVSQKDYHRMMAFFEGTEIRRIPVATKMSEFGYFSSYPRQLKVFEYQQALKALEQRARKRIEDEIADGFDERPSSLPHAEDRADGRGAGPGSEAGARPDRGRSAREPRRLRPEPALHAEELDRRKTLVQELGEAALAANFELPTATVLGAAEVRYPVRMTDRGDWRRAGEAVDAGTPPALGRNSAPGLVGRRKALAEWLTAPSNPLLARRDGQPDLAGHFGRGIVATPNNFGRQAILQLTPSCWTGWPRSSRRAAGA